jgi:prepilin-type processing-associated H-X9-DG protein
MTTSLNRPLKALCLASAVAVLASCGGATSTVDPFHPSRVIGLGDAYNVINGSIYSVRQTGTIESVVGQVAASFGVSNLVSQASNTATISALSTQISNIGTFTSSDLVVLSAGTQDIIDAYQTSDPVATAEAKADLLVNQVKEVLTRGATHVLILPPLEVSVTPYAVASRATNPTVTPVIPLNYDSSPTVKFNTRVSGALQTYIANQGYSKNPVIISGLSLSSTFNAYATGTLTGYFANGTDPICNSGSATNLTGCAISGGDSNYLFADGIHLTPSGNRWVASYMYNSTAQGWR